MAQTIKLKRTSVQGKIPNTSQIDLGELAINTYDGRIFFEKDNGVETIQEILTTNSPNTGSYNVGAISASNDITASNLFLSGNANIDGNVTLGGNITIGDTTSDSVIISAELSSSLIPDIHATFDIGSSSKKWNGLFVQSAFLESASIGDVSLPGSNIVSSSEQVVSYLSNQDINLGTGDISGSNLYLSGDANIDGNIVLGGNITIGDSTTDSITVSADFSSSLIPDSGSTYDLGSSSKTWNEVHAETLYGDGSNITNITVDAAATVSSTFTNSSSITISHNFNTRNILVAVYDNQNNQILPQNVNTSNLDQVVITLSSAQSGTVVVAKGGHIISGSANDSNQLNGQNASYYLDYDNFTNIPSGIVSGSSQTIANLPTGVVSGSQSDARGQLGLDTGDSPTFTDLTLSGDLVVQGTTTTLNTTTFNVEDNIIELNYGGTATEGGIFVKDSIGGSTTSGSLLWDATNDYWKAGISGSESKVLLANGDSIVSSSAQTILHLGGTDIISGSSQLDGTTIGASSDIVASGSFSGSYKGDGSGLTGIQVDQVASVTASFSNQSTINVSHNFDTRNVLVSVYDSLYNQLIPQTVSLTSADAVQVVLSAAHSGHVVVAKGGHVVSGSTAASNISGLGDEIQTLTSYREDVTGASFYTITHNLDERYPFVQAWNTSNNTQEQPVDIESTSVNALTVSFSANFEGKIIVKK